MTQPLSWLSLLPLLPLLLQLRRRRHLCFLRVRHVRVHVCVWALSTREHQRHHQGQPWEQMRKRTAREGARLHVMRGAPEEHPTPWHAHDSAL